MIRLFTWLEKHLEEVLLALLMTYIAVCMIVQIFMRHVMGASLSWSEESIRFAFIWLVFLGFGLAVKEDRHISITFLKDQVSDKIKFYLSLFSNLIFFVYSCMMLWFGVSVVSAFIKSGQTSPALGVPRYLVFIVAPIGFALLIMRLAQSTIKLFKNAKQIGA